MPFLTEFKTREVRILDTEKTGLSLADELLGLTLYSPGMPSAFIFVQTPYFDGIPLERLHELLNPVFQEGRWMGHNIKFDLWVLMSNGFYVPEPDADTMAMFHTLDPSGRKNLEIRVHEDLGYEKKSFKQIVGKNWDKIDWYADTRPGVDKKGNPVPALITPRMLSDYAAEDGFFTHELYKLYAPKVYANEGLRRVYEDIEMPLIPVLTEMKHHGARIHAPTLTFMKRRARKGLEELKSKIYEMAECEFNIGSPKQLGHILYEKMGLPCRFYTKTGAPSTDKKSLEYLALKGYPIAESLLEYSELDTLLASFIEAIPTLLDDDGYLRGDLNAYGTETGRFSSSGPNLQNQPARNKKYPVREAFVASPGNVLLVGDYSQIEPRLMAHLSQDPQLLEIYHHGGDIYQGIADRIHITRKQAKVLVLALMYGMGPQKMADTLRISLREAEKFMADFFGTFRVFAKWKRYIEEKAKVDKACYTLFGRRRLLPRITSRDWMGQCLRQAVNTTIQGSAADLIKITMVALVEELKAKYNEADRPQLILQVHDELVFDCPAHIALEARKLIQDTAENLIAFRVPIKMEFKICHNWSQMKDDDFPGIDAELLPQINNSTILDENLWLLANLFPN